MFDDESDEVTSQPSQITIYALCTLKPVKAWKTLLHRFYIFAPAISAIQVLQ